MKGRILTEKQIEAFAVYLKSEEKSENTINDVFGGTLRGMGKPIIPTVATFVYMCVLRFVWVYAIFPLYPNLTFLYTVWPIGWTLSIITLLITYFIAMSKLEKKKAI